MNDVMTRLKFIEEAHRTMIRSYEVDIERAQELRAAVCHGAADDIALADLPMAEERERAALVERDELRAAVARLVAAQRELAVV